MPVHVLAAGLTVCPDLCCWHSACGAMGCGHELRCARSSVGASDRVPSSRVGHMIRVDPKMPSILIWVLFGRCTGTDPMHIRGIGRVYISLIVVVGCELDRYNNPNLEFPSA